MVPSRRHVLTSLGVALLGGCSEFTGLSSTEQRSPPDPFLTEPADWGHPGYDTSQTRAPPGYAAPDSIPPTPAWTTTFTASTIDEITNPIVADGQVYVVLAGADGPDEFERLVALDARTGEEQWRVENTGSAFAYPPAVGEAIIIWSSQGGNAIHAVNGAERWKHDQRKHILPIVDHGLVLTAGGSLQNPTLVALNPTTGTPYWTRREGQRGWHLLAADENAFYVTLRVATDDQSAELHAINPESGETMWSTADVAPDRGAVGSTHLFTSTGRPDAQRLLALTLDDQSIEWSETNDLQHTMSGQTVNGRQSVAAVTDERLIVHHDFHGYRDDRLEARNPASGEVIWTLSPSGEGPVTFSTPVVAGDHMYLIETQDPKDRTAASTLRVLDVTDTTEQMQVTLSEPSYGTPVVADSKLFYTWWQDHNEAGLAAHFPR